MGEKNLNVLLDVRFVATAGGSSKHDKHSTIEIKNRFANEEYF